MTKKLTAAALMAAGLAAVGAPTAAQDEGNGSRRRPGLWNECRPVPGMADPPGGLAAELGLEHRPGGVLREEIDAGLRRGRLLAPGATGGPFLAVRVDAVGSAEERAGGRAAYLVTAEFVRRFGFRTPGGEWETTGTAWYTWKYGGGPRSRVREQILDAVEDVTDEFVDAYLRANWEACR